MTYDRLLFLTGTPIQNNTEGLKFSHERITNEWIELWSLMNLINPEEFNSLDEFLKEFGELKEAEQVEKLHAILKPYLVISFLCLKQFKFEWNLRTDEM